MRHHGSMQLGKTFAAAVLFSYAAGTAPCGRAEMAGSLSTLSPAALAASPDNQTLYISCATANRVLVFDINSQRVRQTIAVPASPLGLALSKDQSELYVTCAAPLST